MRRRITHREIDPERGSDPKSGLDLDPTVGLLHDPEHRRKPKPGPPVRPLGRKAPISQMTFSFRHGMCAGTLGFPAFPTIPAEMTEGPNG